MYFLPLLLLYGNVLLSFCKKNHKMAQNHKGFCSASTMKCTNNTTKRGKNFLHHSCYFPPFLNEKLASYFQCLYGAERNLLRIFWSGSGARSDFTTTFRPFLERGAEFAPTCRSAERTPDKTGAVQTLLILFLKKLGSKNKAETS